MYHLGVIICAAKKFDVLKKARNSSSALTACIITLSRSRLWSSRQKAAKPTTAFHDERRIWWEHAKSWGLSRCELLWVILIVWLEVWIEPPERAGERLVENGDTHVQKGLHGPPVPSHLLLLDHAF